MRGDGVEGLRADKAVIEAVAEFDRQSFVEYAGEFVRHSFWARAFYMQQRAKGKSHQVAVRALA